MSNYQFEHDYPKIEHRPMSKEDERMLLKVIRRSIRKRRKEEKSK